MRRERQAWRFEISGPSSGKALPMTTPMRAPVRSPERRSQTMTNRRRLRHDRAHPVEERGFRGLWGPPRKKGPASEMAVQTWRL